MILHVVVLNWNNARATAACVSAVAQWRRVVPTIWVVDNGSTGGVATLADLPSGRIMLVRSAVNRGFGGGNNIGIREALKRGADAVLLLNNDATLDEASAEHLIAALDGSEHLGLVAPRLREVTGARARISLGGQDIGRHVITHRFEDRHGVPPGTGSLRAVDYVPGTAVVVRAAVFRRIGLLDEAYFFAGELADLSCRARREGYISAIHLEALAEHNLDRSAPRRDQLYAYYVLRNRFLFVQKFHGGERGRLYAFWTTYGLKLLAAHVARGRWRQTRAIRLALVDGLAGRFGDQNERVLGRGPGAPSRS